MRNIQSDEMKKKKENNMQRYKDLKEGKQERTEKDKVGRQNQVESSRMGRKLRDKCRNNYSSCFSISREVACQVSKSRYIHRETSICCTVSCSLVFGGHFRNQAQALPERLQTEGDANFHGQLLPEVRRFYQKKPQILKSDSLDWPFWISTHTLCKSLASPFWLEELAGLGNSQSQKSFQQLLLTSLYAIITEPFLLF